MEMEDIETERRQSIETPSNGVGSEGPENDGSATEKKSTGLGLIFGAMSGILYATFSLFVRLSSNEVNVEMIAWIRAMESFVIMLPLVVKNRGENIFGRSTKELLILVVIAITYTVNIVIVAVSIKLIHLGEVLTILALVPTFIVIIEGLFLCKMCSWIDTIIIFTCMTGAILCIQPSFIFGVNLRHDSAFFEGYALSCLAAIIRAIAYILLGYLKDLNTYVKVFWGNVVPLIPTTCYLLATNSFKFPSSLEANIYFFASGILALLAETNFIAGTYFDSPMMVAIGKTCDVPLSFLFDVVILGDVPQIWSIFGAILILLCIIVPATLKLRRII